MSPIKCLLLCVMALDLVFFAVSASAQESDKVQDLQRVIEAQQRQLEAQQRQLDDQMQMLIHLQSEMEQKTKGADSDPAEPGDVETTTQPSSDSDRARSNEEDNSTLSSTGTKAPDEPHRPKKPGVAQTDRLDSENPTNVDVSYFDPTAVINIPGTETSIGLHGFVQFQIIHDTNGPAGNQFDTAFIPVDGAPSETKFNVNPTRIAFSSATPVTSGQLNTMISMDFNGQVDSPEPRLRLAYGEYANEDLGLGILGGQTFATMADLRAVPETLDFAVPAGSFAQRQPLLRLTKGFPKGFLLEASLETPQNVRYVDAEKRTRLPDAVLAGTWLLNGHYLSHVRLNALLRDLHAHSVDGTEDAALGWAIAASTKVDLPFLGKRDNLRFTAHHGDGYGTQIKGGPVEAIFNTASSELETIGVWSCFGGIQHFWAEPFRSNLTYGYLSADNPASMPSDALNSTTYASVNFIWNPFKQLTLGVEYLWGRRENVDGASGTSNRLLFSSRLDF